MVSRNSRKLTEDEARYAEAAFEEHRRLGTTTKKCPWCRAELQFFEARTGYRINCTACTFRLTVRGI